MYLDNIHNQHFLLTFPYSHSLPYTQLQVFPVKMQEYQQSYTYQHKQRVTLYSRIFLPLEVIDYQIKSPVIGIKCFPSNYWLGVSQRTFCQTRQAISTAFACPSELDGKT